FLARNSRYTSMFHLWGRSRVDPSLAGGVLSRRCIGRTNNTPIFRFVRIVFRTGRMPGTFSFANRVRELGGFLLPQLRDRRLGISWSGSRGKWEVADTYDTVPIWKVDMLGDTVESLHRVTLESFLQI